MTVNSSRGSHSKVGMVSLGCAKNLIDSEVMLGLLKQQGVELTTNPAEADVIVVNTCTFIETATRESVDTILEMAEYKKTGRCRGIVLAGCMGSRYKEQLLEELPEVDAVIGTGEVAQIGAVVQRVLAGERFTSTGLPLFLYNEKMPRILATRTHSAFVKIAEGCNHRCAFCVIPNLRGDHRSRSIESVVAETRSLVQQGVKEAILIAQDTTWYGRDLYGEFRLADLLHQVADVDGLKWLRLLYAYPTHLSDDVLNAIAAHSTICKYVELPLQHVSDNVLKAMRRQGNKAYINQLINKIRQTIPGVVLRTSFIVGFPGETEQDFTELYDFLAEQRFDHVGIFTYSPEEGTPAAQMPNQIPAEVREERKRVAMELQRNISRSKNEGLVGQNAEVLIDRVVQNGYVGRTQGQAPEIDGVTHVHGAHLQPGDIVKVRITHANDYDFTAVSE